MLLHGHRGLEREPQGPGVQLAVNGGWGSPYQCWISKMKWSLTIFCTISAVACEFMLPPVFGFRMCLHVHITWNFSGLCGTACENMTWNWPVDAWSSWYIFGNLMELVGRYLGVTSCLPHNTKNMVCGSLYLPSNIGCLPRHLSPILIFRKFSG